MGIYTVTTEGAETLAAATAETLIELMGVAAVKSVLCEFGVSFNGTSATAVPVLVELYQITASGTGTAATEVKWDRSGPSAQVLTEHSVTVEPTKGDRLAAWYVHPQGGSLVIQYPLGREPVISDGATNQGLALVCTAPAQVDAVAYAVWSE